LETIPKKMDISSFFDNWKISTKIRLITQEGL